MEDGPALYNPQRPDRVYWLILSVVRPGSAPATARASGRSRSTTRIMKGRHPLLKCLLHNKRMLRTKTTRPNAPNWQVRCVTGPFTKAECTYRRRILARRRNSESRLTHMALISAIDWSHIFFSDPEDVERFSDALDDLRQRTKSLDRRHLLDTLLDIQ